jgi:hypothetical protein
MPIGVPFAASSREPKEREREIPSRVRRACELMIEEGIDRVAAAERVGMRPDSLRRWLHQRKVLTFLRQGHDHHLATLCAANPTKLAEIRDSSPNWTSRVQAIRTMEGMGEEVSLRRPGEVPSPGVVLNIVTVAAPAQPVSPVDITSAKVPLVDAGGD